MPKYQVEILLAAWQDIDKISDFHLKMVGPASAEKNHGPHLGHDSETRFFSLYGRTAS